MANLQYIGARYVPKFYENSLNPSSTDWESGVGYEPLTVVTYNSDTYTSRKPVPGTVGNPADNPVYWAKTADFNAALVALQNKVGTTSLNTVSNNLSDAVNELLEDIQHIGQNRKFVLIGDSFGVGIRGGGLAWVTGWEYFMNQKFPGQCFYYDPAGDQSFEGASAFMTSSEKNFLGQLNYVYNNKLGTVQPEEITDIIVIGGSNEPASASTNDIANYITNTFKAACKTLFPNAQVAIGCFGLNARMMVSTNNAYLGYIHGCRRAGFRFLDELFNLGANPTWDSGYGHLTETGYDTCNPIIAQSIVAGHGVFKWTHTYSITLDTTQATIGGGATITYQAILTVTDKGVFIKVIDSARNRSWFIVNAKAYGGSGTLQIIPFTMSDKFYAQFVDGAVIDSALMFNKTSNAVDSLDCSMTIHVDNTNGSTIRFSAVPRSIYNSADEIAYSWNGVDHELPIVSTM